MTTKSTARQEEVRAPAPAPAPAPGEIVGHCPLTQIQPSPFNVRKAFDDADIAELAVSIREIGLTERLLVRPRGVDGTTAQYVKGQWHDLSHFELVDGERRYRALSLINETHAVEKVPVVIRDLTDDQVRAVMLATREQSRDLAASELVAGYRELAEGRTADEVAAMVGRSPGHVRSVLRLAKLPAWALAAVDAGTLPRATAELVARVPGEESRKRAAYCVMIGENSPALIVWSDRVELNEKAWKGQTPLTYRETKQLLQLHFTRELKGCPFDRKSLDLLSEAGSCDACPKRAGNDADATEEGVRADTCLDPDCYRAKVKAYKTAELARAAEKGIEDADLGVEGFGNPPRGWCDLNQPAWQTDLHDAFPVGPKQDPRREEKLGKLLGKACPQRYLAFGSGGKAVTLVKTTEARKALVELGVIKKAEKPPATKSAPVKKGKAAPAEPQGPSYHDVTERATQLAATVLGEFGTEQVSAIDDLDDAGEEGPIRDVLGMVARVFAYDSLLTYDPGVRDLFTKLAPELKVPFYDAANEQLLDSKIESMTASQLLGLLLQLATFREMVDGPNRSTALNMLAWAELDWDQLKEQARRELTTGTTAEKKLDAIDPPAPDAVSPSLGEPGSPEPSRGAANGKAKKARAAAKGSR